MMTHFCIVQYEFNTSGEDLISSAVLSHRHTVANLTPSLPQPACKISGLNGAPANSIFSGPITSILNCMHFDGDPLTCQCEKQNKKVEGFQISHFYGSFSNDTMAVKGLSLPL